jgi:hypothetical protein
LGEGRLSKSRLPQERHCATGYDNPAGMDHCKSTLAQKQGENGPE